MKRVLKKVYTSVMCLSLSAFMVFSLSAYTAASYTRQNKTLWCWCTTAALVATQFNDSRGGYYVLPFDTETLTNTSGVISGAIGYDNNNNYAAHGTQRTLDIYRFGDDKNNTGSDTDKEYSLLYASSGEAGVMAYGVFNDSSVIQGYIYDIQNTLYDNLWIIGNIWNGASGHSYVMQNIRYNSGLGEYEYYIYDSRYGNGGWYSETQCFYTYIPLNSRNCPITWAMYVY